MRCCDSHAHLDVFDEDGSLPDVLARARSAGVARIVAIGGSEEANARATGLARAHPDRVRATVGFDREMALRGPDWAASEQHLADDRVVAVGETGLDYHYEPHTAEAQRRLFAANLERAERYRRPVVVHTRDADDDTVSMLGEHARRWPGEAAGIGVIHCFTGTLDLARRLVDLGFLISFSGIISFKNAHALREVARWVPSDRLLVETDAPYLAPVPHRGQRNEPAWAVDVAQALASARSDTLQAVAEQTWDNAMRLFRWKEADR